MQVVLSAASSKFSDILEGADFKEEELPVMGVSVLGLDEVLRFFYSGEVDISVHNVIPLYDTGEGLA
jgi:hypothetical protein